MNPFPEAGFLRLNPVKSGICCVFSDYPGDLIILCFKTKTKMKDVTFSSNSSIVPLNFNQRHDTSSTSS